LASVGRPAFPNLEHAMTPLCTRVGARAGFNKT